MSGFLLVALLYVLDSLDNAADFRLLALESRLPTEFLQGYITPARGLERRLIGLRLYASGRQDHK